MGGAHVDSDVFRLHFDHEVSLIKHQFLTTHSLNTLSFLDRQIKDTVKQGPVVCEQPVKALQSNIVNFINKHCWSYRASAGNEYSQ